MVGDGDGDSVLLTLGDAVVELLVETDGEPLTLSDGKWLTLPVTEMLSEREQDAVVECPALREGRLETLSDLLVLEDTHVVALLDDDRDGEAEKRVLADLRPEALEHGDDDTVPHTLAHDDADTLELTDAELLTEGVDDALSHKDGEALGDIVALTLPDGERELEGDARPEGVVNCDGETLGDGDDDA